jgi:hypothetical protein
MEKYCPIQVLACAAMIFVNPALGLLLQGKRSNACKQRNAAGSHRISAFGFPIFWALHIAYWVLIYSHVVKTRRRRNEAKRQDATKEEGRQLVQGSYVYVSLQAVVLPHHHHGPPPHSGLRSCLPNTKQSVGERERKKERERERET